MRVSAVSTSVSVTKWGQREESGLTLDGDVGGEGLEFALWPQEDDQLASAGSEGFKADGLGIDGGDGVKAEMEGVFGDLVDLLGDLGVFVLLTGFKLVYGRQAETDGLAYVEDLVCAEGLDEIKVFRGSDGDDFVASNLGELQGEHADRCYNTDDDQRKCLPSGGSLRRTATAINEHPLLTLDLARRLCQVQALWLEEGLCGSPETVNRR
jgi:hypothetical protein